MTGGGRIVETERRKQPVDDPFLNYICTQLESLNVKVGALHMDMIAHKAESQNLATAVSRIEAAFPHDESGDRDFAGHHSDHESRAQAARTWREIWIDVRKKLFGGAAWAIVVFVAYSLWESFKHEVKK